MALSGRYRVNSVFESPSLSQISILQTTATPFQFTTSDIINPRNATALDFRMELSAETQNALNEFLRDRQDSAGSQADRRVDDDEETEQIQVGDFSFEVKIPEAEWNAEKKTLFATMVWNGARSLGNYLIQNARDKVIDRRVLEFGAGVGIPSLVCNALGATFVCVSDYPTEHILSVIQQNICLNARSQSEDRRMDVIGYKWGTSVESLLEKNNNQLYDLIIASECLWRHEQVLSTHFFVYDFIPSHSSSRSMTSFSRQSQRPCLPQAPPSSHFLITFLGRSKMT
jgi:predicted nicotinamide N-methyase